MTKKNLFINILFLIIAIIFNAISQCSSALSDKRLCYNPDCSEPVSLAKTTIKYAANEPGLLNFDISVKVKVYSKEAGNRTDLWGVEINGKHGYVPKRFLKEYKIIHKDLHYEVPINQLSKSNKVSNTKHQSKEDNHKLVFDIKDVKASNVETDNLDLKSTEELPYNVTPSYKIVDGTTLHLDDEPFVQPTSAAEVIQATIVSNKQNAVDNLEINSSNDNNESNIFAEDTKLPQDVLNDELKVNKQSTSGKLSIKDFVVSSKEVLLDTNANLKSEVENLENNSPFIAKNASALEDNLNINISQTHISDKEISIELDKTVVINDTNIHAQDIEKIDTFDGKDVKLSESATSLGIEQNESKAESKTIEHLSNIPPSLLGTNITGTIEAPSSFSENVEGSLKNTDKFDKKDPKLLQNDGKSQIKQGELKEENRNTKDLGKHNKSTANLKLPLTVNKGENNEGINLKTHSDETISFVSQNSDLNINKGTNTIIVSNEENDQNLEKKQNILHETYHNIKEISEVINKSDGTISFVSQDSDLNINKGTNTIIVSNEENDQNLEKKQNILHETHHNIKEITEVTNKSDETISFVPQDSDLNINKDTNIIVSNEENDQELEKKQNILHETYHNIKEMSKVINKVPKADETISFVSQDSDLNINKGTNIIVPNEENDQELEKKQNILHETHHNIKEITEVTNKSDETISFVSQDSDLNINKDTNIIVSNEENDQELEKKQNILHETYHNIKEMSEVINKVPKADETISFVSQDSDLNINKGTNIIVPNEENDQELEKKQNILHETRHNIKEISEVINKVAKADDNLLMTSDSTEIPHLSNEIVDTEYNRGLPKQLLYATDKEVISENAMDINEFRKRDLLNIEKSKQLNIENVVKDEADNTKDRVKDKNDKIDNDEIQHESLNNMDALFERKPLLDNLHKIEAVSTSDICTIDNVECSTEDHQNHFILEETLQSNENTMIKGVKVEHGYWLILIYLSVTATATLIFSLGYYYIENLRRDKQLISRVNELEKDLLIATKECTVLHENLKTTKEKLTRIEDESFGSNEMVLSLKADLEVSQNARTELEDQVAILEKDVENATEAGLELERMLREVLSSNNEVNPLAQSVEDLQARLNAQQAANDSLTNALKLKTQENESLSTKLASLKKEYEELEVELARVTDNLKLEENSKNSLEQTLSDKAQQLEMQIKEISTEKATLQKKLKNKEAETKDLLEVINQLNSSNLDLNKLYDVSHIKAEATALLEEKNELKIRLVEIEGAHHLLEEHMKVIKEEVATLSEQCKVAEKEKKDAETRLEVLTNFFEEKEAQRQKEEAIWLQQQGEVVSTVERIQAMQTEIQNYKQQIEMLKREVLDQEREYKNQISVLETKAHEQWVIARQVERRLEESKVEAGQLRNRLTLIEKNINDADSEAKLHRLEANGETTTSPPLFIGAESSSSPIMFSGSSSVPPPPPPSYLHSLFPPYLPPPLPNTSGVPPYDVSQRPPPLGGRLSSPPPMPLHPSVSSRYDNAGSPPPPPMSPRLLPPFNHRSPPPPPFGSDIHPPPPPPPGSILPPPLGTAHSWGEESLPPPRNSGFHPSQRVRIRNRKGSLHSSGESLDKTRHNNNKV